MQRRLLGAVALVCLFVSAAAPIAESDQTQATNSTRAGAMQFALRQEALSNCANGCRTLVAATGMIRAETAREFENFAAKNNIRGATLVLNSEGGSVHGAIALGRLVRRLDMITTVGRIIDTPSDNGVKPVSASFSSRGDCESMCAFVLLAGTKRVVPADARVRVHQIWLGDRRDDAAAAVYSAEDLVLVQRDIGRLAQYTVEMGGSVELLEIALRIPPWEPMRALTRDELKRMKLDTSDAPEARAETPAGQKPAAAIESSGARRVSITGPRDRERGWTMSEKAGVIALSRRHPLTIEGEELGTFDVTFVCGENVSDVAVLYSETRRGLEDRPQSLKSVEIRVGNRSITLAPGETKKGAAPGEWTSTATGTLSATLLRNFASANARSLTVDAVAASAEPAVIRIGNTGAAQHIGQFLNSCTPPVRSEHAGLR